MKLYVNPEGKWVGTQAEAKNIGAKLVEVPTDKPSLIKFLNTLELPSDNNKVKAETTTTLKQPTLRPHPWQTIRECAQKASIKDLTVALAVFMDRVDELADKTKNK